MDYRHIYRDCEGKSWEVDNKKEVLGRRVSSRRPDWTGPGTRMYLVSPRKTQTLIT